MCTDERPVADPPPGPIRRPSHNETGGAGGASCRRSAKGEGGTLATRREGDRHRGPTAERGETADRGAAGRKGSGAPLPRIEMVSLGKLGCISARAWLRGVPPSPIRIAHEPFRDQLVARHRCRSSSDRATAPREPALAVPAPTPSSAFAAPLPGRLRRHSLQRDPAPFPAAMWCAGR